MGTKFATSTSRAKSSREAGREVAKTAIQRLEGQTPSIGLLFCSADYQYDEVIAGIKTQIGEVPLVGCSSAGGFTEEEVVKSGVALALIASDTHQFFTGIGHHLKENEKEALKHACHLFPRNVKGYPNLSAFLFLDGLAGKGEETVLAASDMFHERVKFAGGAAADSLEFKQTHVFCGEQTPSNAVSVCYTASKNPLIIKVGHGHKALTQPLTITKAHGNILYEIDGRPAADIWKEYLLANAKQTGVNAIQLEDPNTFSRLLLKHEAGLVTRHGYKMRFPTSCNPDKSLNFVCTITEGAVIKIMDSTEDSQIASARDTARSAHWAARGAKIAGAVIFDCACRGMILKDRFPQAVAAMKEMLPGIPIIGFETYGEIAMEQGELSGFHNTTTVIALIPD